MFSQELRDRLLALKVERDSGLLPEEIYVDMCRKLIRELGPPTEEDTKITESSSKKAIKTDDFEARLEEARRTFDDSDKRKFNRGVDHRRSYTKEEKLVVIVLKESGMPADEVAKACGISRSNVEKWTTEKTKLPIIEKCKNLLLNGMFNKSSINFVSENEKLKKVLFDSVIKCFPSSNTSLDPATADLLVSALLNPGQSVSYSASISSSSAGGGYTVFPGSGSLNDLPPFDDDLADFGDVGDFPVPYSHKAPMAAPSYPSGPQRSVTGMSTASSNSSSSGPAGGSNKTSRARKASGPTPNASGAVAGPPAKRTKFLSELLEAAGMYYNEQEGSSSMDMEDYIRPSRVKVTAPVAAPELPAKVISAVDDREAYEKDRVMNTHHTRTAVSDMTMSYDSSALSDDRFSTSSMAASTTTQALRPVLKNTAFLTSFREELEGNKGTILDDRGDQKLTAQEQLEEDREIMKFLGERRYKLAIPDKNDIKSYTISEV